MQPETMYSRARTPNDDEESVSSSSRTGDDGSSSPNFLANLGRILNIGAIGALSVVCAFLFIQLQAVSMRVASEQQQINDLKR